MEQPAKKFRDLIVPFFVPKFLSIKKPHPKMRFIVGGGGGIRTLVQLILSDKDYMFRSRFFIPSAVLTPGRSLINGGTSGAV